MKTDLNPEILDYSESVFFGMTLRQCICAAAAIAAAVALFILCRHHLGLELSSWVCMLGASPFAALGFVRYHGMNCEQFLWAWLRSEILEPKTIFKEEKTNAENGSSDHPAGS